MRDWFEEIFATAGQAVAEARHELLGGWFGRNFEPHPQQRDGQDRSAAEQLGWEQGDAQDHGIDR